MELVITLLLIGGLLLLAETVLPGLVAGTVGLISLVAGVVVAYYRLEPGTAHLILGIVLFGLVAGSILWVKFFPDSALARPFISRTVVGNINTDRPDLLHKTGVAQSPLRPSGTALIDGQRVDVITEGTLIDRGTPVEVVAVEGIRIVVRPLSPTHL